MALTHQHIISLKLIKGCGDKSILYIGNYINDNKISISCIEHLWGTIDLLKSKKILKRFPAIDLDDLRELYLQAGKIINNSKRLGIGTISYWDDNYPEILRNTIDEDGKNSAPLLLYYRGNLKCLELIGIAIIGSREITKEGNIAGKYFAKEFAQRGFSIVSGLAIGADTCGHLGALEVSGKTIAFLAHGLDTIYPSENRELAETIVLKDGLLLSEYPIGTRVNRYNLVARDRLQAGLSQATIVVQTGIQGGTMHAANATLKSSKPLYCVWFNSEKVRQSEKARGNEYLVSIGGKYIKANDNIDKICQEIKSQNKVSYTLF